MVDRQRAGSSAGSCKQSVLVASCRLGEQKCAEKFRRILGSSELDKEQGAVNIRTIIININSFANRSLLTLHSPKLASCHSIKTTLPLHIHHQEQGTMLQKKGVQENMKHQ